MDRRTFLLATGALGVAACAKPERDLLESYEGVDLPLEPGTPPDTGAPTDTGEEARAAMDLLRETVPEADRPGLSFYAEAVQPTIEVTTSPDGTVEWTFENPIPSGDELVFLVEDYDGLDHYRVLLPTRPNGSFGWIHRDTVQLRRHNHSLLVELDSFRLTLFDHQNPAFEATIGVARENAPTPLGRYYTTELLQPPEPNSVYGAFAYGLSGFSDTFTTFNGGPGQLGIHGTNDPESIGTNVSSGCIRLHDDDITRLVEEFEVTPGVPVQVV